MCGKIQSSLCGDFENEKFWINFDLSDSQNNAESKLVNLKQLVAIFIVGDRNVVQVKRRHPEIEFIQKEMELKIALQVWSIKEC